MCSPAQVHHTVNTIQVLAAQTGLCAILVEEGLASTPEVTPHLARFLHRLETTYQGNKNNNENAVYT